MVELSVGKATAFSVVPMSGGDVGGEDAKARNPTLTDAQKARIGQRGASSFGTATCGQRLRLERFRFKCCHLKIMRGGIFLRKMPLGVYVSVKRRIETAVG
jgi:hypothetical protein